MPSAPDSLSRTLTALADPTRRAILVRLAASDATVSELAEPFAVSQPAISKHVKVLRSAGLLSQTRSAQRRPCHLEANALREVVEWTDQFRRSWEASFQRLDSFLAHMQQTDPTTPGQADPGLIAPKTSATPSGDDR